MDEEPDVFQSCIKAAVALTAVSVMTHSSLLCAAPLRDPGQARQGIESAMRKNAEAW